MGCQPSKDAGPKKPKKQPYLLQDIKDHKGGINCMVLSDDGSLLVTGSDDKTARMWSTLSDPTECLGVLEGHEGYITCCAVHEQCVLTGSSDATIRKWFIATAECMGIYTGHSSRISRLLCVGQLFFSTSSDHTVRAWLFDLKEISDDQGEACIKVFEGHSKGTYPLLHVPMDENAGLDLGAGVLISGSADCTARSWSVDSGLCLKIFRGHTAPLNCLAYDEQKQVLYTAGGDGLIRSWNLMSGEAMKVLRGHEGPIFCLLIHKRMLYSGSSDKSARSWVLEFGECTRVYSGHRHTVSSIRHFDGMLYTGCGDTISRMYEAKSGTLKRTFKGHENAIVCVEVVPGKLFTGSYDGSIRVWTTAGVRDETVFGTELSEKDLRDDEIEEDSEDVKKAVKSLDPYLTY
ncbi:WD repeat-containing protein 86 [Trichonephila inaurata madagascariensis]|uniref:WD repeat-containing protein 86 n=1 Tax=Trichonephila inaurata madagascariensis TaxID=2747483 RepID=A0A8X7CNG0_9ARAC|nr:WD repeat-containing protein 86 [Trichonephila inaurata madagascariensis]